ncbi:MAG: SGNH/GDSL hydrolase family protein [Deltaproteobacteria bacterium]|nr:SGNH/GDSL hydrolase family protein [Deltaproteobacteria bacterium]
MLKNIVLLTALQFALAVNALACPLQSGLVDFNCDGKLKIAFVGDSFAQGIGDTAIPNGGYFARIAAAYPDAEVVRFAVPGVTSKRLLSNLKRKMSEFSSGPAENNIVDSDILVLDVGRNDFYEQNNPPATVGTIKRIVKYLNQELAARNNNIPPVIAVATLTPTKRLVQRFFITYTNDLMIEQKGSALPLFVRVEKISKSLISSDGLHPSSNGYAKISQIMQKYFTGKGTSRALALRPDSDNDGVYNLFETSVFDTNPAIADTDGDGFSDSDELFVYDTNPNDSASHPI